MAKREASHSGPNGSSWYESNRSKLSAELDGWLKLVPESAKCIGSVSAAEEQATFPQKRARIIIAPHAGYAYSGPAAAWAYKALDLSNVKRVFILGPSHHFYLSSCALSRCESYETPLGDLRLDLATISELDKTGKFERMSQSVDEDEHSIEMHLPYLYKIMTRYFSDEKDHPPIVPILVGNTSGSSEAAYGKLLAPYLSDSETAFIVSSDFAHWGTRFRYTYYEPGDGSAPVNLRSSSAAPTKPPIHTSIANVDMRCVGACERGAHAGWLEVLSETGNTVCGRHPIGIVMAGLEALRTEGKIADDLGRFKFVRYERSSDVKSVSQSSVSYASAFAVM